MLKHYCCLRKWGGCSFVLSFKRLAYLCFTGRIFPWVWYVSGWKSPNLLIHTWILRTVGSIVKPMKKLNIFSPAFFPHHLSWYSIQEDMFLKLLNNHAFRKLLKMHSMSNLMFVCPEVTTTHSSLYVIHYHPLSSSNATVWQHIRV